MQKGWQLQDAKEHLGEVIRRAERDGPQVVTVRGREAAVVVSIEEYRERWGTTQVVEPEQSLASFLLNSPLRGSGIDLETHRMDLSFRDLDLGE